MHARIPDERLAGLLGTGNGLSTADAEVRRARHGRNDIVEAPPPTLWRLLRDTLRDPMLWFLLGTAALFAWLGDRVEATILLVALIPLLGMDAYLHRRTQASTRGLAGRLGTSAQALRDGRWRPLPAGELVPGDLVEVHAGEAVPADGLVQAVDHVQLDEAMLSGESLPVSKRPWSVDADPTDPAHWVAAGTRLLTGQLRIRIAYTGGETLYGGIVRLAVQGTHARTPLQQAIARLVRTLLIAALAICALLAAIRLSQGHGLVDALLSAVTLAVAALPEEFPVVFTFFLGAGVYRLARRQALVRRAVAVENIGRVTCICSDKTGTMTEGRLALAHSDPAQGTSDAALLGLAALACRADSGDPLDAAILALAPAGADGLAQRRRVFPFTEARRRETAIWQQSGAPALAVTKGAPETVLGLCAMPEAMRAQWRERVHAHADAGHKVIAFATRELASPSATDVEPDAGFAFRGLLAFADPLRAGVREAVRACRDAGIRVLMVTGDHPGTARAIAAEAGLGDGRPVVATMAALADADDALDGVDVVARAVPAQKLELVQRLQRHGEIVAVTGDGVNDAPALQAADVGIAMGGSGSQSSRELAAIVLLDDNFRTIVGAIAEGRQLFRNLQSSFAYLLMVHLPLVLTAAIVPMSGGPLLYLPIHIVWLELLIHPTALLAFQDPPPSGRMAPVDRERRATFFGRRAWTAIVATGLAMTAAVLLAYAAGADDAERARTLALATLVLAGTTVAATLSALRSRAARVIAFAAPASLLLLVQVPALAAWVHLRPLDLHGWALATIAGVASGLVAVLFSAGARRARHRAHVAPRPSG